MAALGEAARWRTSARGWRYLMATLSDATGQVIATCFDDAVAADLEAAATTGGCGLLTVELDRRAGEETPRVTVTRLQPFAGLAKTARMVIERAVDDPAGIRQLAELGVGLAAGRDGVGRKAWRPGGGESLKN